MHFTFTEEQQMLEDTVRRFVARDYTFERRRAIAASPEGWSREVWNHFAELGLLGLNVPEEHGGLDAGAVETMLVMNALGRGLVVEPYLASAVLATWLIRLAASETQQRELLPALARGETVATVAQAEPGARYELNRVAARAERTADGYRLRGRKSGVLHGAAADWLIVSARTAGEVADRDGISLFLLRRDTPGLEVRAYPAFDGLREAEVFLNDVHVPAAARLGAEGRGLDPLERACDIALAALCAEATGIMQALLDATLEYLRTRRQFGQPIGRFQALQHRAVDMLIHYEQAKSMTYLAAIRSRDPGSRERRRALSAAKVAVGRAGRFVGQQAVQLHGGMGMTDELIVSHYFKRLTAIELTLGDTDSHLEQFIGTMRANG
ncbi:MAG TPA: acyl-CoA dehydrogenase family protein [Burkholderiales bacterium]